MKYRKNALSLLLAVSTILLPLCTPILSAGSPPQPERRAKLVRLDSAGKDYLPVLGPPESVSMRSGLVVLAPGKSVGKHSTEHNEELLIVLEGNGQMSFKDGSTMPVSANNALYCPPETEHNVTNTGTGPLRYVYVVASTK